MSSRLKYLCLLAVLECFITPKLYAKVVPITHGRHQLSAPFKDGSHLNHKNSSVTCSDYNLYESAQSNYKCQTKDIMGGKKKCYRCWCDKTVYKYTVADQKTGFVINTADKCTEGGVDYYKNVTCDNNSGYFIKSDYNSSSAFNGITQVDWQGYKCYYVGNAGCSSGLKDTPSETKHDGNVTITYNTVSLFNNSSTYNITCTTGINTITGAPIVHYIKSGDVDTGASKANTLKKKCTKITSASTEYHGATYWYYTGTCDDGSGNCVSKSTTTGECLTRNNTDQLTGIGGTKFTCDYIEGCEDKGTGTGCRGETRMMSLDTSRVDASIQSHGSYSCYYITGCKSGYYNTTGSNAWLENFLN